MSFAVVLIVAIVIIGVIGGMVSYNKNKELAGDGKIIARQSRFFEEKEIFTTSATYQDLRQKITATDLSDAKVKVYVDVDGRRTILFKSTDAWNAVLEQIGEKDGKNVFQFYFPAWQTSRNGIVQTVTMNVMATAVEKLILSLDPSTTVETHKMQIKTKPKFF